MVNKIIEFFKTNGRGATIGFIIGALPAISAFVFKPATEILVRIVLGPVDFILKLVGIDASLSLLVIVPIIYLFLGAYLQSKKIF